MNTLLLISLLLIATVLAQSRPEITGKRYDIIKDGSSKISSGWKETSWGIKESKYDKQSNMVNYINSDAWGSVSFERDDNVKFESGYLFFKARTNSTDAVLNIIVHNGENFYNVGQLDNISTTKMVGYGIEFDVPEGVEFNKISIQDGNNKGIILCLNDVYFVGKTVSVKTTTTTTTTTKGSSSTSIVKPTNTGKRYDIIKNSSIVNEWSNWSWGVKNSKFNQGIFVSTINGGEWGALSFKRTDNLVFGSGTLYFSARASTSSANLQILVHTDYNEVVTIGNIAKIPTNKMAQFSIDINLKNNVKFDRITIQDMTNRGLTLYISDVYFVTKVTDSAKTTTTTTTSRKTTTTTTTTRRTTTTTTTTRRTTTTTTTTRRTTTTTTTTRKTTTTTASYQPTSGVKYDIIKKGGYNFVSGWENWSWGIGITNFDNDSNLVQTYNIGDWGGVSFKKSSGTLGSGTFHFVVKADENNASLKILVHSTRDEAISITTINNIPTDEMKEFIIPVNVNVRFNRITIQDITNKGITIYLNDVYYVDESSSGTGSNFGITTTTTKKSTTTSKFQPTRTGTIYGMVEPGNTFISKGWQDWSWGCTSSFKEENLMVNKIDANEWGAVSFKRVDDIQFGSGTLYFKASISGRYSTIQLLVHTIDGDYLSFGNVKLSTTATDYKVDFTLDDDVKFDRISFQDANNNGINLTISDVYYVEY